MSATRHDLPRLRRSRAAAGVLAAFAALANGCSPGDGDGDVPEVAGSLDGASFAPAPEDAGSTVPAAPVAAAERAVDGAPADAPGALGGGAGAPDPAPGATATHDPEDGVQAVAPPDLPDGVRYLAFDDVAWAEYEPLDLRDIDADAFATADFPAPIRALDGARVAFDGYMVPVDFEERRVTSFILSRYLPGCCFGVMPRMDEWIEVEVLDEDGVEYFPYQIVRVTGAFEVGELLDDYGYVRSIYRIRADDVEEQH
jgi:hypothetical protein